MQHPGTQNTADPDARAYRTRTLKIFGGIQIGMGILCGILSLVGVIIDGINMNKYCSDSYNSYTSNAYTYQQYYSNFSNCIQYRNAGVLFGFNMTCLIFSGWVRLHKIYISMCFQSSVMYTATTTYTRHECTSS